jgi:multidrug efflux system membrane fusion protein
MNSPTTNRAPTIVRQAEASPGTVWARRRRLILYCLAVVAAVVILVLLMRPAAKSPLPGGAFAGAPVAVNVATAEKGDMQVILNALGTVTPLQTVTVVTQISGQLQEIYFTEGQMVKKGDPLALIDPRPYQAALNQAQGTLAKDQALLADAQLDLKRYQTLVAQDSIAKQTLDTQAALVKQYQATIISDQATIDTAKLNLSYCHIVSPVTGRIGLRQVDPGNYVTPTSTSNGIVVVTELQPISVIFTLPEDDVLQITQPVHAGQTLQATAFSKDNTTKLGSGTLATYDNQIDTTTGTFKLRALFDNPDTALFPNQFVNIQLLVNTLHDQTIVPAAAIQHGAPGAFVYVVNADSTVAVKPVKLGVTQAERQAIVSGIDPGVTVVTDGVDRLRDGAKVILPGAQPPAAAPNGKGAGRKGPRRGAPGDNAQPPQGAPPTNSGAASNGQRAQ